MKIIDKQTAKHYQWGEKCNSWIMVDTDGLSIKQETMPSGASENLHFHSTAQQFFFVLKGAASFYIDNEKIVVSEQKGLLILPNDKHYITNETNQDIEFLVISQPTTTNDRTNVQ